VYAIRALAVSVALVAPRSAWAQACCAGSTVASPARLALHEDELVGLSLRGARSPGSFAGDGTYRAAPGGTSELDFEQDLVGALRFLERGQASLQVPLVETHRATRGRSETGGGVGDVTLAGRWDFTLAGASTRWPGIAALAAVTLPTGRAVESSTKPLATDATGTGALAGAIGLGVEQTFGSLYLGGQGSVALRATRHVQGTESRLAPLFTGLVSGAWIIGEGAVGLSASVAAEGDATIDGVTAPDSGKRTTTVSVGGATPIVGPVRMTGVLFATPWISGLSRNQLASTGLVLTGIYAWM
jgi:hypothetical protein